LRGLIKFSSHQEPMLLKIVYLQLSLDLLLLKSSYWLCSYFWYFCQTGWWYWY